MIVQTSASALRIRSLPEIRADTDTGKRLISGQRATAYGLSFDSDWTWITAPQGEGWASTNFLFEVRPAMFVGAAWVERPHGLIAIRETFGPACGAAASAGLIQLPGPLALSWQPGSIINRFSCHALVVPIFESFFNEIHRRGLWHLLDNEWGGSYNCRMKSGTSTKRSTHSWGIAVDVAVSRNQFGRIPQLDRRIVAIAEDHQLVWGGNWSKPDGMHFQYATGY